MKFNRLVISLVTGTCVLAMPLLTQAHSLTISNNTMSPLSFSVNKVCSEEIGTVYEKEIHTILEETLNKICSNFESTCEIVGYNAKNCTGKPMGGIKYISEHSFEVLSSEANVSVSATESSLIYTSPLSRK